MGTLQYTATLLSLTMAVLAEVPSQAEEHPIWLDTDAACGLGATDDVDDCWALLLALKSESLAIRGVSTVFGNVAENRAYPAARQFLERFAYHTGKTAPPVYRGAAEAIGEGKGTTSQAARALATALEREPLTVVALGPLTNVAALLRERPDMIPRVRSVIAIAGSRTGQRRFFFRDSGLLHFHDLNFLKDPQAFDLVIKAGVPLALLPFEAAQQVRIGPQDLDALSGAGRPEAWLAESSLGWLDFWQTKLGEDGFHPFDSLAVGYAVDPTQFYCEAAQAQVQFRRGRFRARDELLVKTVSGADHNVTYCRGVSPEFHSALVAALGRRLHDPTTPSPTNEGLKGE